MAAKKSSLQLIGSEFITRVQQPLLTGLSRILHVREKPQTELPSLFLLEMCWGNRRRKKNSSIHVVLFS